MPPYSTRSSPSFSSTCRRDAETRRLKAEKEAEKAMRKRAGAGLPRVGIAGTVAVDFDVGTGAFGGGNALCPGRNRFPDRCRFALGVGFFGKREGGERFELRARKTLYLSFGFRPDRVDARGFPDPDDVIFFRWHGKDLE